jgi:hypothetical protein
MMPPGTSASASAVSRAWPRRDFNWASTLPPLGAIAVTRTVPVSNRRFARRLTVRSGSPSAEAILRQVARPLTNSAPVIRRSRPSTFRIGTGDEPFPARGS